MYLECKEQLEKLRKELDKIQSERDELTVKIEDECLCGEELDEKIQSIVNAKADELLNNTKFKEWLENYVSELIYNIIGDELSDFIVDDVIQVISEEIQELIEQKLKDKARILLREALQELNLKQLLIEYLEQR
jgi:dephospho-CoA kinase